MLTFRFYGKKHKNAFFQECVFINQILNKFFVCVWTARRTTLKNIKKVDIFGETEFLWFSKKSQFLKSDYRFWKLQKAASWDQSIRLFGCWPLGHNLQSKFSPFCNQKFPPILHTSSLNAKFWNFNSKVVMQKKIFPTMLSNVFTDDLKALKRMEFSDLLFFLYSCTKKCGKCIDFFSLQAMVILGH